jgi:hypothetical protein
VKEQDQRRIRPGREKPPADADARLDLDGDPARRRRIGGPGVFTPGVE